MNRCGFAQCAGGRFAGGGGSGWLAVLDSIALWILAIAAVLFLLGLRRRSRSWGRDGGRGGAYHGRGPVAGGWPGGPGGPGWSQSGPAAPMHQPQAEATLADRFSRGEITAEEYRTGIDVLRGHPQGPAQAQGSYAPGPAEPGPAAPIRPEPPAAPADPVG